MLERHMGMNKTDKNPALGELTLLSKETANHSEVEGEDLREREGGKQTDVGGGVGGPTAILNPVVWKASVGR